MGIEHRALGAVEDEDGEAQRTAVLGQEIAREAAGVIHGATLADQAARVIGECRPSVAGEPGDGLHQSIVLGDKRQQQRHLAGGDPAVRAEAGVVLEMEALPIRLRRALLQPPREGRGRWPQGQRVIGQLARGGEADELG